MATILTTEQETAMYSLMRITGARMEADNEIIMRLTHCANRLVLALSDTDPQVKDDAVRAWGDVLDVCENIGNSVASTSDVDMSVFRS